jgi:hypothetical protein
MYFVAHPGRPTQHLLGSYHCAHLGCSGQFEAHHKFLLEENEGDCGACARENEIELDPDVVPVLWYPPLSNITIKHVDGEGWVKTTHDGEEKERKGDAKSLSDVDSVKSHWKYTEFSPAALHRSLVTEQLAKLPQHIAHQQPQPQIHGAPSHTTATLGEFMEPDIFKVYPDVRHINGTGQPRPGQVVSGDAGTWAYLECGWVRLS